MRYRVNHSYMSRRDGVLHGPWDKGESVELPEELAAWINRDSPGTLTAPGSAPEPSAEPAEETPSAEAEQPGADDSEEKSDADTSEGEQESEGEESSAEEVAEGERGKRPARNRQRGGGKNRSA